MASPRFRQYLRPPRKLSFTRDGRWFVTMTLLVGFGAVNTGNNLLYLLLGMMLGLIIVSGILSERVLHEVTVRRLPMGDIFAGRPSRLRYEIRNAKRFVASYSITIQEHESRETRRRRRVAQGLPPERPTRRKAREAEGDIGGPKALSLRIPAKQRVVTTAEYTFPLRGLYEYAGLDLGTRFPFGFFEKSRPLRESCELLVYPAIRDDVLSRVEDDVHDGEVARQTEGRLGEFFGLREYREGDDLRDVHWKVSARRNKLVRRLYDRRDNEAIALHLYDWLPATLSDTDERLAVDAMEEAIVLTASICHALAKGGHRFSLHTLDAQVDEGAGAGQLQTVLRHLALMTVRRDPTPPHLKSSVARNRLLVETPLMPEAVRSTFEHRIDEAAA